MSENYQDTMTYQTNILGYVTNINYHLSPARRDNSLFQYQSILLNTKKSLVESAYSQNKWLKLLLFLKLGFTFPEKFNIELVPPQQYKFLKFINKCQTYSELIRANNFQTLIQAIETRKIFRNFRNIDNQSAVTIAVLSKSYEVYVLLRSKGFSQFTNEVQLEVDKLPAEDKFRIKRAMIAIAKQRR